MENIEKLYCNLHVLDECYHDMPDTIEASRNLERAMGEELYAKYEDDICICKDMNEKQGFVFGFQYAVSLLTSGRA